MFLYVEAWYAETIDKRWSTMEYEIHGNNFTTSFKFVDELDPNEDDDARLNRILKARYGDKPIYYPPL